MAALRLLTLDILAFAAVFVSFLCVVSHFSLACSPDGLSTVYALLGLFVCKMSISLAMNVFGASALWGNGRGFESDRERKRERARVYGAFILIRCFVVRKI